MFIESGTSTNIILNIRLCKWLKQLDSKLSPVKGFMGSNPLSMMVGIMLRMNYIGIGEPDIYGEVNHGITKFRSSKATYRPLSLSHYKVKYSKGKLDSFSWSYLVGIF